jgi:hypothetical protein
MATRQLTFKSNKATAERIFVIATNSDYAKMCNSSLKRLRSGTKVELLSFAKMEEVSLPAQKPQSALWVSRLADLSQHVPHATSISSVSKQLVFLGGLPVEAMASRLLPLNIRNPERLHIAAQNDLSSMEELIRRVVCGMAHVDGSKSIVDAWVEGEQLVLLSPLFVRLNVPLEKLSRFIGTDKAKISKFELDEDGRFLFWPHSDTHLGWTQFQQIVDPASAIADIQKTKHFNQKYGAAIRSLRESHGLKQTEIEGITDRQLRRVEKGDQAVSTSTLSSLAKAHSLSLGNYLNELSKRVGRPG